MTVIRISWLGVFLVVGTVALGKDSWNGLKLDQTTVAEAVEIMGVQPASTKERQKLRTVLGSLIDKEHRYVRLEFKKLEKVKKAKLYFLDDILRAIEFELRKKVNPNSLQRAYGTEFMPKISGMEMAAFSKDHERHEGRVYPKTYPLQYNLIGITSESYIVAAVAQGGFSFGKVLGGVQDDGMSFPGEVWRVLMIARSLEDNAGLDALE